MEPKTNETPNNVVVVQSAAQRRQAKSNNNVSLIDVTFKCLHYWYLIVLSVILFAIGGEYYVKSQEPVYTRSAAILIKTSGQGSGGSNGINMNGDNEMGLFSNTSDVDNELIAIQSPSMIPEVIARLHLNMNYMTDGLADGLLHKVTLYGKTLPVVVDLKDIQDTESASLALELKKDAYVISKMSRNGQQFERLLAGKYGKTIKTPLGRVCVTKAQAFSSFIGGSHFFSNIDLPFDLMNNNMVYVSHSTMDNALGAVVGKLSATINGKQSSVIDLTYVDVNTQRAEDFLNTLISVYNENWVKDRNQICVATNEFIAERIKVIEQELGNVDSDISHYKSANLIPDLQAASSMNLQEASAANKQTVSLNNQLTMSRYVRQYITNRVNAKKLIPANTGMGSTGIEGQIEAYNTKMLQRNSIAANSSESNGMVQDLDAELKAMHNAIVMSIDNQITTLNTQLASSRGEAAHATGQLARNPSQAKYLLSVERQQGVKEALYTFLLQKREENELSQAFVAYNTRVITTPCGSNAPTGPNSRQIMLVCLAIGFFLPIAVLYIKEAMVTTVRGRKDLENMKAPFLGEIPEAEYRKKNIFSKLMFQFDMLRISLGKKKKDRESDKQLRIVVKPDSRNVINEAFRIIRSNLKFDKSKANKVIMITSVNSGSGKSFVTLNLGVSFAIMKTRVLLIDLDMRKRSLSKVLEHMGSGVANYLAYQKDDISELIVHTQTEGLDILPVGDTPPNPTELLNDERLGQMISKLRDQYDLILLDCPPVEIVADPSLIVPYADKTIFLIRANLLERSMIPEIDKMFTGKTYGNMSVLLNGTIDTYGKYGYHRYGYRYGYHYGYGSSY